MTALNAPSQRYRDYFASMLALALATGGYRANAVETIEPNASSIASREFLVQPRTTDRMDVEDSRIEWKEAQAPFYPVATIRILKQAFDTPEQNAFCENLSFTPWHALPEHKPLGVTNRLRKIIYDHISRVRHEMNDTRRQEP